MHTGSLQSHDESTIENTVIIARPLQMVYGFYRDFRNLPRFLGDVIDIEITGPSTSTWTIQGPFGFHTHWTAQIVEDRPNQFIHYETASSPRWRTSWKVYFCPGSKPGQTEVREVMKVPLGKLGRWALGLVGKFPAKEVSANLHRLKQVLETGTVTDTSDAISGKFQQ